MKAFWDERYSANEFAYGVEPNVFFEKVINDLKLKGTILLPAEGEGRNAVFAAKKGLDVSCFDMSLQGKQKALKLASLNNVNINYVVGEFSEINFKENSFDVIALIYAHFPLNVKSQYHQKVTKWLKKDGILILEGFSKKQLEINKENNKSFGPKSIEMLYTLEEIENDFKALERIQLFEEIIDLNEGIHHKGKGSVIRFIGKNT
ncbi:class I SAM-dependent methyltransferase [uncultured Lutibacter sp.]|uniref:class I SAM-dependent methyltransferase n=1 Tax=uncultured Lutibacter sp. TaxID=437739 RepID=UPI002620D299|nr:class I SAM-dependent methyltransferase [uncultured Lutibacter sp.]